MSVNGHLYSEATCIKRSLCDVPKHSIIILTSIKPPLYKGHYQVSPAWPFNIQLGFSVDQKESMYRAGGCNDQPCSANRTNLGVVELDSSLGAIMTIAIKIHGQQQ